MNGAGAALFVMSAMMVGQVTAGSISTQTFRSDTLGHAWRYNLYLPDGYEGSDADYPVIYLLHGSGGDETGWDEGMRLLDVLVEAGKVPPCIAVAPSSGTSWWVDGVEDFETAVMADLIPHVDATYRTIARRDGRGLAGYSMGGYGALRFALTYPDVFGAVALLSPSLYDGQPPKGSSARSSGAFGDPFDAERWTQRNYPEALRRYLRGGFRVSSFIGVGDDDWNEPAGWEYNIEYQAVLLYERLSKQGGSPAELRILDGGHDWDLWRPLFTEAAPYMFEYLSEPEIRE